MALEVIRQNMVDRGAGDLLKLLPSQDTMRWRVYPTKDPQSVLVISCVEEYELLACRERSSTGQFAVQYCSQQSNEIVRSWLTTDLQREAVDNGMVVGLPLDVPFRYSVTTDPPVCGQSDLSILIQWYFLGKDPNESVSDVEDYCSRLHRVLRKIKSTLSTGDSPKTPAHPEDDTCTPARAWFTPDTVQSPNQAYTGQSVCEDVLDLLGGQDSIHLLTNLPSPNPDDFINDENPLPNMLARKLPVGEHKETQQWIFAYLRAWGGHHRVELYMEQSGSRVQLKTANIARHVVYHPFDKTYPESCQNIDKEGQVRLSLLIKWYFVVAGVAEGNILREMNNPADRLCNMFQWVQDRIRPDSTYPLGGGHPDEIAAPIAEVPMSVQDEALTQSGGGTPEPSPHLIDIETLSRSIIERVTERVTEEISKDQQDECRLSEIELHIWKFQKERGGILRRQRRRRKQWVEADTAVRQWNSSRTKHEDD